MDLLPSPELPAFADWVDRFPAKRARLYPPLKITRYVDLWHGSFLAINNLSTAVQWFSSFLGRRVGVIKSFLHNLDAYELAWLSGRYSVASGILDDIESSAGLSVWLIQARIALLQRSAGLEAQKSYVMSIHEAAPGSVPSYIAHYTSWRNEDTTSIERYNTRIRADVLAQSIKDGTKVYVLDRLVGNSMPDESTICTVLCTASSTSIIDAYEAWVEALTEIISRSDLAEHRLQADRSLSVIDVPDWRLTKLQKPANWYRSALRVRELDPDDALLAGDYQTSIKLALQQARESPLDLEALAIAATAYAVMDVVPIAAGLSSLQSDLLNHLTTLTSRRGYVAKAAGDLEKLVQNLRSVRTMKAVAGYRASLWLDEPQTGESEGSALFFSSPYTSVRQWSFLPPQLAKALLEYCFSVSPAAIPLALSASSCQLDRRPLPRELAEGFFCELSLIAELYHSNLDEALSWARQLGKSEVGAWERLGVKLELYCLILTERTDAAIRLSAAFCSKSADFAAVVPLRSLLGGKRWRDLRHLAADIALPILLDVYWHTVDEAEHETTRRIAYDEFLKAHGCTKPSELRSKSDQFERRELIYFLDNVCLPEVMDVSFDVFPSSRAIRDERINICALLAELDAERADQYTDEIRLITKYQTIQDGLRDVDSSRVHVDTEAVLRWAERQLRESFDRYKDLLKSNVGFGSDSAFENDIRALAEEMARHHQEMQYPEREGDSLLIEMFDAIRSEYLNNPDYGLDAYLSMRVRHGSLSGHLRGPLEERGLIVNKNDNGEGYKDNVGLADSLSITSEDERRALFKCCEDFSRKYDSIIEHLTKDILQIRTAEKPQGMFSLTFERDADTIIIHFIRSRIEKQTPFNEFLVTVLTALSILLQRVSLDVRDFILKSVKEQADAAFEMLRSSLETNLPIPRYLGLNSRIAAAIPEVQAAIDRVADWFVPVQQRQQVALRTVEQIVDIGIEAARRAHLGFSPKLFQDVEHIEVQSAAFLSDFTDILFTVLDNVYCHSGSKSPWIKVRVWVQDIDQSLKSVHVRVDSEIAPGAYKETSREKIERIKERMVSGNYRKHVNLEGGSGLLKLKRLVSPDARQRLEFGFGDEQSFFVEISLVRLFARSSDLQGGILE